MKLKIPADIDALLAEMIQARAPLDLNECPLGTARAFPVVCVQWHHKSQLQTEPPHLEKTLTGTVASIKASNRTSPRF